MRIESGISRELGPQVSMAPDGLYPRLLTLLAAALVRSLSVTFERPQGEGEVSKIWRRTNFAPVIRKDQKHNLGNTRQLS